MSHTGELKKTRIVSNSSGSARVIIDPAAARLRRRHLDGPAQDRAGATRGQRQDGGDHDGLERSRSTRNAAGSGRRERPPAIATDHRHRRRDSAASTIVEMRDTNQPTNTAMGSTRTSSAEYEPFRSSRLAVDVDGVFAGEGNDERGVGQRRPRMPANAGADRGNSRRNRAPGRSTAGRPRVEEPSGRRPVAASRQSCMTRQFGADVGWTVARHSRQAKVAIGALRARRRTGWRPAGRAAPARMARSQATARRPLGLVTCNGLSGPRSSTAFRRRPIRPRIRS